MINPVESPLHAGRRTVLGAVAAATALSLTLLVAPVAAQSHTAAMRDAKPTIVLVHGAFAESASWNAVVARLIAHGYPVIAIANPLRGQAIDAPYVASALDGIKGAVVLVGHSYAGTVI